MLHGVKAPAPASLQWNQRSVRQNPRQFTPHINLLGGRRAARLSQGSLDVLDGKNYEGRIILAGDATAFPIEVSLVWESVPEVVTHPLRFKADASTDNVSLAMVARGTGNFRIGTLSLMPADYINGMRRDTLELMNQIDSPVYRWPGGSFVGGYDWREGIGKDRDRRSLRGNPT